MTLASPPEPPSQAPDPTISTAAERQTILNRLRSIPLTSASCLVCILVFVGVQSSEAYASWDTLASWGYLSADRLWSGAVWGLITSVFVHIEPWHLAFNVYWLWVLGGALEQGLGPRRWALFVLATAFVSSGFQLGASDATGHGASGVVYGIAGLMWAARNRIPGVAQALDDRTIALFLLWLVGCFVATWAGLANIGNAAHLSGLVFGAVSALHLRGGRRRLLAILGGGLLLVAATVPLFWMPWSASWHAWKAYRAHAQEDYDTAIEHYSRAADLGGDRAWALEALAGLYRHQGRQREYDAAMNELRDLDPEAAARVEDAVDAAGEGPGP